jgi:hypothetical protein
MQATVLAFRANVRYGVPNTEDERLSHAVYLMDSEVTLSQAAAVCMVSERALRTRWTSAGPTGERTRSACCATSGTVCCRWCGVGR